MGFLYTEAHDSLLDGHNLTTMSRTPAMGTVINNPRFSRVAPPQLNKYWNIATTNLHSAFKTAKNNNADQRSHSGMDQAKINMTCIVSKNRVRESIVPIVTICVAKLIRGKIMVPLITENIL